MKKKLIIICIGIVTISILIYLLVIKRKCPLGHNNFIKVPIYYRSEITDERIKKILIGKAIKGSSHTLHNPKEGKICGACGFYKRIFDNRWFLRTNNPTIINRLLPNNIINIIQIPNNEIKNEYSIIYTKKGIYQFSRHINIISEIPISLIKARELIKNQFKPKDYIYSDERFLGDEDKNWTLMERYYHSILEKNQYIFLRFENHNQSNNKYYYKLLLSIHYSDNSVREEDYIEMIYYYLINIFKGIFK